MKVKQALASMLVLFTLTTGAAGNVFAATGSTVNATLNDMKVSFNSGETKTIQTYMINDFNYVRVREVVAPANYSISPCGAPEVGVMIDSEFPYVDAGLMEMLTVKSPDVTLQTGNIYFNGQPHEASCFNYADRYYFKLADIQAASDATLAAQVDAVKRSATVKSVTKPIYTTFKGLTAHWDASTNTVYINTPKTDLVAIFNAERNSGSVIPTPSPTPVPSSLPVPKAQQPLTEPPIVGSTLANIMIDPKLGTYQTDGKTPLLSNFTTSYTNTPGIGSCTWYAYARLWETTGIDTRTLYTFPSSSITALNNLSNGVCDGFTATTDKTAVSARSIAIWASHMVFVEYVEKDNNGNPLNIYYTEVNNHDADHTNGVFYPNYDAVVKRIAYNDWLDKAVSGNSMLGYIKTK